MKILKLLGYWYTQYYFKKAMKLRKNGHKGTLFSDMAEFRRYKLKE